MIIYHNPRCSKSRQALAQCRELGVEPEVVEYLRQPLSLAELQELLELLGGDLHIMTREKDLKKESLEPSLELLASEPRFLQRPILREGEKAAVCRAPEEVERFLQQSSLL